MFTMYRIEERSVAESVPYRLLFTLGKLFSKQFLLRNSTAPEQYCSAPLRSAVESGTFLIGWVFVTVRIKSEHLSEQKLQRNLVLVDYLFKSKGIVTNCITDRASVHTGNASEQFLYNSRTLVPVHTVPEQLLKRSKNLSGTV